MRLVEIAVYCRHHAQCSGGRIDRVPVDARESHRSDDISRPLRLRNGVEDPPKSRDASGRSTRGHRSAHLPVSLSATSPRFLAPVSGRPTLDARTTTRANMRSIGQRGENFYGLAIREAAFECNDRHSHLNRTPMRGSFAPRTTDEVVRAITAIRERGEALAVAGACHAMGGQQFARDAWLLDTRSLNRVLELDRERGLIRAQAGITWPELIVDYSRQQYGREVSWGIRQKQTGADRLTLGGAVSANIHGRGLRYAPFVEDIESLQVVLASGEVIECNRQSHPEVFRCVVGG